MAGARERTAATEGAAGRHIDQTVLARLVDDLGREHVVEVCELFLADAREGVRAVRTAGEAGDADGAARSAHRLKSASGFVGAGGLSALCREIEDLAGRNRLDEVMARVELVGDEFQQASVELVDLLGRLPGPR